MPKTRAYLVAASVKENSHGYSERWSHSLLYATIADAMADAVPTDIILLESGYINDDTATVTVNNITVSGDASSTGIVLQLDTSISTFFLAGTAPINVLDALDANAIVGNDGDNTITVTGGADSVTGGLGIDRLVVDYHLATGAITGTTASVADAGGLGLVTIVGGFENFTILTGSGADTITTGDGDDIISTGNGASTVVAGQGANIITGGDNADTVTALDGGNIIDGGDGDNTLTSGGGNDVITGGLGIDIIVAGGGDDLVTVRGGADTSNSGAGNDRLIVDYSASTTSVSGGVTAGDLVSGYSGSIADLAGNSVAFLTTENFTVTTGIGTDDITTGDGIDILNGGAGEDQLNAGGGADDLDGGGDNDALTGGAGDDTIDGGTGVDTAFYSGAQADYTVTFLSPTQFQITDDRSLSPDGTDTLTGVEFLQFSDSTIPVVFPQPPEITSNGGGPTAAVDVAENTTAVTTVTATDPDLDTPTFSLGGGADQALFSIDETTGALAFVAAPDFENPTDIGANNTYDVIVRASDGNGGEDDQAIAVTVTDVNEAPAITSNGALATAAINVAENTTAVTTVTATDPDLDTPTFSLAGGADQALFSIDAATGALAFVAAPDFENPADGGANNVYDVIVRASDGNGGEDDQAIAVTVTDVNDAPAITSNGARATAAINVAENTTAVTTVTATDPDLDTPTFSLAGGADQALFSIDAATGALAFITAPDFENPADGGANNVYDVMVRASDGNGGEDDQAIAVTVTDVNDAPAITSNGAPPPPRSTSPRTPRP